MAREHTFSWYDRALARLPEVFRSGEKTADELYIMLLKSGMEPAPNGNTFGRVVAEVVRRKQIAATGERRPIEHKPSHGRTTSVYRRVRSLVT